MDALSVLINVKTFNPEAALDHWFTTRPVFAAVGEDSVAEDSIKAVMAGWAGYFLDMSRRPDPPGIPTLRESQRRQGQIVCAWLR